jgi:hypothetical protein
VSIHRLRYFPPFNDYSQSSISASEPVGPPLLNAKFSERLGGIFLKVNCANRRGNYALASTERNNSPSEIIKIMNTTTESKMDSEIENNGSFPRQMFSESDASNLAANGGNTEARPGADPRGVSALVGFSLAVLAVLSAGILWAWAVMQLGGLFLKAEAILLRNPLPLN